MPARPFFVHPYAQDQGSHGVSAVLREQHPLAAEAVFVMSSRRVPERRPRPTLVMREMMAETKVTLATHQLGDQVKESRRFWSKFRDEYLSEVKGIKLYAGVDILQQIWRKKVASNDKYKRGSKEDYQQFDIQAMKLESCLNQLDETTQLLAEAWSSDYNIDYDSRQHHLAKVRAAGNLVVNLSKRAVRNESACKDLLEELAELEKLINPKSSTASMLHNHDNRQSQDSTRSGKGKVERSNSNRPDDGDMNNQTEHESNGWQESNEHESYNWSEDNEAGRS
ncbi:hypothetical protein EV127DRAFT_480790 [Xylaria flabelliformis]|nr:hypothetical protein EV127DRAFT_480790 [Xylaria flabelliformis]